MGQMLPNMRGELHEQHRAVHRSSPHLERLEDVVGRMVLQRRRMQVVGRAYHPSREEGGLDDA